MLNKTLHSKRFSDNIIIVLFFSSFILSLLHYYLLDRQSNWDECSYLYIASTASITWTAIWKTQVFGFLTFLRLLIGITGKGYLSLIILRIIFSFIFAFSPIFIYKIFKEFNVSNFVAIISTFFCITSPIFLYVSPRILSDGPSFCFGIIGCYFFISWLKYEIKSSLILSAVLFILTFTFRPPMIILPLGLAIALISFRLWDFSTSILIKRCVILLTILIIPSLILLLTFQLINTFTGWLLIHLGSSRDPFYVNIVRVGFVAGFLWPLSIIGFLKRSRLSYMLLIWALISTVPIILLNLAHITPRHLLSVVPSISLASGIGIEQIFSFFQKYKTVHLKAQDSLSIYRIQILSLMILVGNFIVNYPRYEINTTDYTSMMKWVYLEYEKPIILIPYEDDFQYLSFVYPNENIYFVMDSNQSINRNPSRAYKYGDLYLEDSTSLINLLTSNKLYPIFYVVRVYRQLNTYNFGWPANDRDITLQFITKFNTILIYEVEIESLYFN